MQTDPLQSPKTIQPFIEQFESCVIGSVNEDGTPFCSYAPYLYTEHCFYLFISDIATHAKNLKREPRASLFFIEDEHSASNIFARKRISLQCDATVIDRDSDVFERIIPRFKERFEMVGMLMEMADFNLFALRVTGGEATFGFAEAYRVGGEHMEALLPRRAGGGHRKKDA